MDDFTDHMCAIAELSGQALGHVHNRNYAEAAANLMRLSIRNHQAYILLD